MPEPLPRLPLTPPAMRPDSAAPPPPGMHHPGFPPAPYPRPSRQRRWPAFAAVAVASAAAAATIAAVIATQVATHRADSTVRTPATVTLTATPSAPPPPAPLPAAQADRATCNAWHAAGDKIHAASHAISVLPDKMTILDPQVRSNPEWSAAVRQAAELYAQAGDTIAVGIAPGTSVVLSKSAAAAGAALHALSTAEAAFDVTNGNAYDMVRDSADTMDVLCERLAPH
jgi:hypothetical protein